ncbi:alkaline phytoceramidase (aPHC) [Thraustotheca clavata]|uniref:Alkaline phytoceramidase (APHC) n=1 Tax=Thraustotheca clavata TaxID=74557 RepID=A0A1V9ZFK6_9STRA|nr:alkaline phytoceramidase (aPHC) [Thraustotheca clavata]
MGYWDPVSSTIDWCEPNYVVSYYIAEFWNTISNLSFLVLGFYGLYRSIVLEFEWRFILMYTNVMIVGLGSAMFHGSLTLISQQCDETPMIWSMLIWTYILYSPLWQGNYACEIAMRWLLALFGIGFAIAHAMYSFVLAFQLLFAGMCLFCLVRVYLYYIEIPSIPARRLAKSYICTALIGTACWMLDYHHCDNKFNLYGHAWWHFFMGLNAYYGPLFTQYVRAHQLKWSPAVANTKVVLLSTILIDKQLESKSE